MVRNYAAFISYRHRPLDIAVAKKIHKSIERYTIPKDLRKNGQKRLGLVFRDREELPLSNNLTDDIFTALDNSAFLIVVCTPDTPDSLWCRREIQHFIEKHGRQRVITVLAAGTPEESIPKEITTVFAEDGQTVVEQYEPLCAYLVDHTQKKVLRNLDKELLRLYAAMLNCPYDALRQRHKRQKMQRLFAATSLAFAVALAFIGMLVNRNQKIEAQNLQIAAQKKDVQLRESELLSADAREALAVGDTRLAITQAVAALPKEGDEDRPYYAPAESALLEAMDIFGGARSTELLKDTVLEQMTPISHFDLNGDGSHVVTIDDYSVVHCFDTVTGEELWSRILSSEGTSGSYQHVRFSDDGSVLLCRYDRSLQRLDPLTGEVLWSSDLSSSAKGYFIYDDNNHQVALLASNSAYTPEGSVYSLDLTILSADTGEVTKQLCLEQTDHSVNYEINNASPGRLPMGGCFSADGRYFACAMASIQYSEDTASLVCFAADLETGTVLTAFRQDTQGVRWSPVAMEFREDALYLAAEPEDDTIGGTLCKLDWQNNKLLWQTTTPQELDGYSILSAINSRVLFWNTVAFVGRYDKLYALSLDTGEILGSTPLPGNLTSLYTVGDTNFGFSLDDGTYAIGWFNTTNGFRLSTEYLFHVTVALGEHSLVLPYYGGIIQFFTDGNYTEISVSNRVRPGYLAVVNTDAENQLVIKRPVNAQRNVEVCSVEVPVEQTQIYCAESAPVTIGDNTLILGMFYVRDENYDCDYFYIAMDRTTHLVTQLIDVEDQITHQHHFFPDGSGYVQTNYGGTASVFRQGTLSPLTDGTDPAFLEDQQYRISSMVKTRTCYLADGNVLTAHFTSDNLTLYENGVQTLTSSLPQSQCYREDMGFGYERVVKAGKNGLMSSYCCDALTPPEEKTLSFFDVHTGTWLPDWVVKASNENAMAFAETKPLFALVDADHNVRIYDPAAAAEITSFPLQLPQSSVLSMDFLLDDSCLVVKTKDADVLIFDIASGEILYQDKLATSYSGRLTAYEDTNNQRLYLIDTAATRKANALCIDLRSWTTLGTGGNMVYFDRNTGELYHLENYYNGTDPLTCIHVPNTGELVTYAQALLQEEIR